MEPSTIHYLTYLALGVVGLVMYSSIQELNGKVPRWVICLIPLTFLVGGTMSMALHDLIPHYKPLCFFCN